LGETSFQSWILPLVFEKSGSAAILRCPNPFFRSWIQREFVQDLDEVLAEGGLTVWSLELFTEEQRKSYDQEKDLDKPGPAPAAAPAEEEEALQALPVDERYVELYKAYPRKERFEKGLAVFRCLTRWKALPKTAELIKAVKRSLAGNPSWQREDGRYIPQVHNWLKEKRWMD